ncbi:MAG: AAA family ATPase [Spirochaetales bacterium]|nr:AAA family ATPase [Spirochaetales bacterium]
MKNKSIAIGQENFKTLIDGNCYYVDKTQFVKELITKQFNGAKLFLRPKRFGKTLSLSTLKYFFDIDEKENAYLFNDLAISKEVELCKQHQNKYPVIFFTLKGVTGKTKEEFLNSFNAQLLSEYKRHRYIEDKLDKGMEINVFNRLLDGEGDTHDFKIYLSLLMKGLYEYYKVKPIVLIDEYDVPLNSAHSAGCFEYVVDIIKEMFSNGLKTNDNLKMAIITGCLQIAKNQIFTGFNNPGIYPVTSYQYAQYFGFTKDETIELLTYYGFADKFKLVAENYDGYNIGNYEIFNPFDLINYLAEALNNPNTPCLSYWANSSGNVLLKEMLISSIKNKELKKAFEQLISGQEVIVTIDTTITYNTMLENNSAIMGTLLFSGYLTVIEALDSNIYKVVIPNKEILKCFIALVDEVNSQKAEVALPTIIQALLDKDIAGTSDYLNKLYSSILQARDKNSKENNYHYFLAAILALNPVEGWEYRSQDQGKQGYSDFVLVGNRIAIIIEEKNISSYKEIDKATAEAFKQIKDTDYEARYEKMKYTILKYAIVYCKHEAFISIQEN